MFCFAEYCSVLFCFVLLHLVTLRVGLFGLCQHAAFLARFVFFRFLVDATRLSQTEQDLCRECIKSLAANFIALERT